MPPLPYHVVTTAGSFDLMATSPSQASSTALELAGPSDPPVTILRVTRQTDW
jgi:hypothetical protein